MLHTIGDIRALPWARASPATPPTGNNGWEPQETTPASRGRVCKRRRRLQPPRWEFGAPSDADEVHLLSLSKREHLRHDARRPTRRNHGVEQEIKTRRHKHTFPFGEMGANFPTRRPTTDKRCPEKRRTALTGGHEARRPSGPGARQASRTCHAQPPATAANCDGLRGT